MAGADVAKIEFRNIRKSYGTVVANDDVSFAVRSGTVHGVLGENGAGKSTILKGLYGLHTNDSGRIFVDGRAVDIRRPEQALKLGIGMVQQHFLLVPSLPAWRNVILGCEPKWMRPKQLQASVARIAERYGFRVPLEKNIEDLTVGQQQQVELLKLLYRDLDVLILDEPTAVLAPQEIDALFERLRELRAQGKTVLLITHKLREVFAITEHVTVLRQGRVVADGTTASFTEDSLAEAIIGKRRARPRAGAALPQYAGLPPLATLRNVTVTDRDQTLLDDVSLDLRPGEIVGIAGVEGNGQDTLVGLLAGVVRKFRGEAKLGSTSLKRLSAYRLRQQGVAVVPADRHREAVLLSFSLEENTLLGHQWDHRLQSRGVLLRRKLRAFAEDLVRRFEVRPPRPELPMRALSGGNQQKLVLARELARDVRVLVAAHPTRGVDIGSIDFLHERLLELRRNGAAVLLVSSELEELLTLADRIVVLYRGSIAGETTRAAATEQQLGIWMTCGASRTEVPL